MKQNQISPDLMEALQLYKFSIKKERLRFTAGWSMQELEEAMGGTSSPLPSVLNSLPAGADAAVDIMLSNKFRVD